MGLKVAEQSTSASVEEQAYHHESQTEAGGFTAAGPLPAVAPLADKPEAPTASQHAYGDLTDEQIEKLVEPLQSQNELELLLKKFPHDRDRIATRARASNTRVMHLVDAALRGIDSDPTQDKLTTRYGVRPRKYGGALDGNDIAEIELREGMPEVAAFISERARANGHDFTVSVAELTTNLLAEGGILLLQANQTQDIDGFGAAGIDTFMNRYKELTPWLHGCIKADQLKQAATRNEKGERVTSIGNLTLIQTMYANAAMYAAAKVRLARALKRQGKHIAQLTPEEQMYWTTWFFNAGEGKAEPELARAGVAGAHRKWTKEDDHRKHNRNPHFNALVRTSTFEYTRDVAMSDGTFKPIDAKNASKAYASVQEKLAELRQWQSELQATLEGVEIAIAELESSSDPSSDDKEQLALKREIQKMTRVRLDRVNEELAVVENARAHQLANVAPPADEPARAQPINPLPIANPYPISGQD
jgi:hypothetical protein